MVSEAIARHRKKKERFENDPDAQMRHARWLAENKQQHLDEPHKDKPIGQEIIDSIHAWAAEHPELIPRDD